MAKLNLNSINNLIEKRLKKVDNFNFKPSRPIIYKGHKIQVIQKPNYLWDFIIDGALHDAATTESIDAEEEAKFYIDKGRI